MRPPWRLRFKNFVVANVYHMGFNTVCGAPRNPRSFIRDQGRAGRPAYPVDQLMLFVYKNIKDLQLHIMQPNNSVSTIIVSNI